MKTSDNISNILSAYKDGKKKQFIVPFHIPTLKLCPKFVTLIKEIN